MPLPHSIRALLPLVIGLVVGGVGATLFLESMPGGEGSPEARANKLEQELKQANNRIAALEATHSEVHEPRGVLGRIAAGSKDHRRTLAGAAGWFLFTRAVVESRWFPGHLVPLRVLGFFAAVMLAGGVGLQALLEAKGARFVGMTAIFVGVVPVMAGTVLGTISDRLIPLASWLIGISPVSLPVYASATLLSLAELPAEAARAVPRAFHFWLFVAVLVAGWLVARLWAVRLAMARTILAAPAEGVDQAVIQGVTH